MRASAPQPAVAGGWNGTTEDVLNRLHDDAALAALADNHGTGLANLFYDAVTGMAVLDAAGRFRLVNDELCRILGRDKDELVGKRPAEVVPSDDGATSGATAEWPVNGSGTTDRVRKRFIRPDGSIAHTVCTATALRDAEGRPVGLLAQVMDVTHLVETQDSLRRSETRLRVLAAYASDITVLVDPNGIITYASPATTRVMGRDPAEVEGLPAFEFVHPDDAPRALALFAEHLATPDASTSVEYRVRHRDGQWRVVEAVGTNLLADDSVAAVVVNIRDITDQRRYQDQVAANERRFRALVGNSWDILSLHDAEGRYLYCSPSVTAQMGFRPEEMIGVNPFHFIHRDDAAASEAYQRVAAGEADGLVIELRLPHKNGSWRRLESTLRNRLDDPAIGAIVVTTRDVTATRRRTAQQNAIASVSSEALQGAPIEAFLSQAVRTIAAAVESDTCAVLSEQGPGRLEVTARWGIELIRGPFDAEVNGRATTLAGKALKEGTTVVWDGQRSPADLDPRLRAAGMRSGAAAVLAGSSGAIGSLAVYSRRADAFSTDDVSFLEAAANVLAAAVTRYRIEGQLRRQALHDTLTGLPNRLLLLDRLGAALTRLRRHPGEVAVMFIDLDNFKLVNDSMGHSAGDRVVAEAAKRIVAAVRPTDTVARFGGDEFVVVCENADERTARNLAERIRQSVATPVALEGRLVTITSSIGYAVTGDATLTPDDLLARADTAMYVAKESGKDCFTPFALQMRAEARARLDAVSGIRRALANDEFCLLYQPIVDARTGTVVRSEALLRWNHPTAGLVGPGRFIDYAEASGLIIPLGKWIVRTACRQSAAWRARGHPGHMSINISGRQLTESDIVTTVAEAIRTSGAHPGHIFLEVTENAIMSDLAQASAAMDGLRKLGVHVGMDDFGTGRSSLSQLAHLAFDFVKIDQSFVQHFDTDRRTAALLETIVTLCRALDLPAIAEGVETPQQYAHLRKLGVPFIQGFLFGHPMTAEDLEGRGGAAAPAFRAS